MAAGCAFYGTLALFPAISMLISLYGLMFDPVTVEPQLATLQDLLPPAAFQLIAQRVHMLVTRPPGTLTTGLLVSTAVALWSSATGTKSIISALNLAYEERERRSFLRFQVTAFIMTFIALLGAVLGLGLLVALPPTLAFLGFDGNVAALVQAASGLLLVLFVLGRCRCSTASGHAGRPRGGAGSRRARSWRRRYGCWRRRCSASTWATWPATTRPTGRSGPWSA